MGVEHQPAPLEPEQDLLHLVFEQFDQSQTNFLVQTAQWAKLPIDRNLSLVAKVATVSAEAYQNLATTIIYDEDFSNAQKADILSRLTRDANSSRKQALIELAPTGDYTTPDDNDNSLGVMVSSRLEAGSDLDEIIQDCINTYTLSLDADLKMLIGSVKSSRRAKLISLATNSHLVDLIKLSSAGAIGGVVAHQISKKIDSSWS